MIRDIPLGALRIKTGRIHAFRYQPPQASIWGNIDNWPGEARSYCANIVHRYEESAWLKLSATTCPQCLMVLRRLFPTDLA